MAYEVMTGMIKLEELEVKADNVAAVSGAALTASSVVFQRVIPDAEKGIKAWVVW